MEIFMYKIIDFLVVYCSMRQVLCLLINYNTLLLRIKKAITEVMKTKNLI